MVVVSGLSGSSPVHPARNDGPEDLNLPGFFVGNFRLARPPKMPTVASRSRVQVEVQPSWYQPQTGTMAMPGRLACIREAARSGLQRGQSLLRSVHLRPAAAHHDGRGDPLARLQHPLTVSRNSAPPPSQFLAHKSPPEARAMSLARARPSPNPSEVARAFLPR